MATENGVKYMKQLCRHWGHKFTVEFDETHGRIELPQTVCTLDVLPAALKVSLDVTGDGDLKRMETVVEEHVKRFAFNEDLMFSWASQN